MILGVARDIWNQTRKTSTNNGPVPVRSRAPAIVLTLSTVFAVSVIYIVHKQQKSERTSVREAVYLDIERQRKKKESENGSH